MKHFLSLDQHRRDELEIILDLSDKLKRERRENEFLPLKGQTWAMIFSKTSTRTRVSFEVGVRELGGQVIFLSASDMQLGRGEPIKDTARVLGRMVHGAIIRTYAHQDVKDFAAFSNIHTVNALTDHAHPCQIVADLMTIREKMGNMDDKVITFVGDGACNVATSWIFAAKKFGFQLRIAAPKSFSPDPLILQNENHNIIVTDDIKAAVADADVVYTDVWVSMGKEEESLNRQELLSGFQIDMSLMKLAKPGALLMHCLPAYRGMEVTEEVLEFHAKTIFDQAENRLHAQKAILAWLVS
ncbi:ornithine carbamoyltransferase [Verrucomicrobia bacterium]|nr:ornithine carbamoyltransferase [Verrucomicrobiota bacterium]MDB4665190.1 ornithine carbamoyltransferase [Verrucomicrobiota bacterium]